MITNFHNKKMPKEKAPHKSPLIIMLDSVIKANKKYYLQTILEECKYKQKKINIESLTDDELGSGLMMKQSLILIMLMIMITMNMTSNLLKVF